MSSVDNNTLSGVTILWSRYDDVGDWHVSITLAGSILLYQALVFDGTTLGLPFSCQRSRMGKLST